MQNPRIFQRSFVGGEVTTELFGRIDDAKYQNGAKRLRNMIVKPRGAAQSRPGLQFVRESRNSTTGQVLYLPFRYGLSQSLVVECGPRSEYPGTSTVPSYFRFHSDAATLFAASAWSASTAYAVGTLVVSSSILYYCKLAHTNQAPPNTTYWKAYAYVASQTVSGVNTGTDTLTTGATHNVEVNDPVEFTTTTTLPAPLVAGTVYYCKTAPTATTMTLAATVGGATIDITTAGSGTITMHRRYNKGDLVSYTAGQLYYCRTEGTVVSGASVVPGTNETYWYALPTTNLYEIPCPFVLTDDQRFTITYSQVGDVMSLSELNNAAITLSRVSATNWRVDTVSFAPTLSPPTTLGATAGGVAARQAITSTTIATPARVNSTQPHYLANGDSVWIDGTTDPNLDGKFHVAVDTSSIGPNAFLLQAPDTGLPVVGSVAATGGFFERSDLNVDRTNYYVVTAVDANDNESVQSIAASVTNNLFVRGAYNTVFWPEVVGATAYRVYKKLNGTFGFIGEVADDGSPTFTFRDDAFGPDLGVTPPFVDATLNVSSTSYPRAVTHFEGRRLFGGTLNEPQKVWGVRSDTESNLTYHLPLQPSDRINRTLKAATACVIHHLVPAGNLIALTDTTEFRIFSLDGNALTPETFASRPRTYNGATQVQPEIINNTLIFVDRGNHLRELAFSTEGESFATADLSERAAHRFDGYTIRQIAYQRAPYPILWAVSSSGHLLGVTYSPEQQLAALHVHDSDDEGATFESVCVITEGGEDRVYVGVKRTVNGATKRYLERMGSMRPQTRVNSFCVDSGLTLSTSSAVTTVSGLSHLEGETVSVLANGIVQPPRVVSSGAITLVTPLSSGTNVVHVGLPIQCEIETVAATFGIEAFGGGRTKNTSQMSLRVQDSGRFQVGPTENANDLNYANELPANTESDGTLASGIVPVTLPGNWTEDGGVLIRMADPLPLTVVAMTLEVALG